MKTVRMGIIGLGNIGMQHAACLLNHEVDGASLVAVADGRVDHVRSWVEANTSTVRVFEDAETLIDAGCCDAVIVATPHFQHPPLATRAFSAGLHVLIEKPAGVYARQVREMNAAAERSGMVFCVQFPYRHSPVYSRAKAMIDAGELGRVQRIQWTSTQWFRTQDYYDSGGWRGTWRGEGGGILLNQCPHDLDLWQWLFGMPSRVRAFCRFGQWHDIEVEDEVTAYLEYANGASGVFVCSTGEFPGINRLDIVCDRGLVTVEEGRRLNFHRTTQAVGQFLREHKGGFGTPDCWNCEIPVASRLTGNKDNLRNFVRAILHGDPLVSPGREGLNSLLLSNAMHLSTWLGETVEIPFDDDVYHEKLTQKIDASRVEKNNAIRNFDIANSFR